MISIIVPVYNTEKYLARCIESLIKQTYKNIEIILVDDGSTDSSGSICKKYAANDNRIKYYYKENGGQGSARNIGIDKSNGDYIAFVDSDDYVEHNMYEILLKNLIEYNASISACCNSTTKKICTNGIKVFIQPNIMMEHLLGNPGTGQSPCDKLFDRKLFDNVRFAETRAYEDCATLYLLLSKANKFVFQDTILYHYIMRENSTMTQSFSEIKFMAVFSYQDLYKFYCQNYPQYLQIAKQKVLGSIKYCVGETYSTHNQRKYNNYLKNIKNILRENNYKGLKVKDKIIQFLIINITFMYGLLYKIIK